MDRIASLQNDEQSSASDKQIIIKPLDSSSSYRASSDCESVEDGEGNGKNGFSRATSSARRGRQPNTDYSRNLPNGEMQKSPRRKNATSKPPSYRYRSTSCKHKAELSNVNKPKTEHTRSAYNDHYRQLLNVDISDVTGIISPEGQSPLPQSQIGATNWSSAEKDIFFTALSRLGKDNVRGISLRIGSKSEPEVQEYIKLLHQGMVERSLSKPRWQLLGLTDFPTALQISQECCDTLEKAADGLAIRQDRYEDQVEESKWGSLWLLTPGVSRWVEEKLAENGGDSDIKEILPAATLLNLQNWLELSARVFMNPGAPREAENWRSLVDPDTDETPAIRATAFEDFYRIAINTTRRLVSASIFCTISRLRAMDPKHFNRSEIVRRADVEAAINSIGLEANSEKLWVGCPRRCNLAVYRYKPSTAGQTLTSYDELETILGQVKRPSGLGIQSTDESKVSNPNSPYGASPPSANSIQSTSVDTENPLHSTTKMEGSGDHAPSDRDLAAEYIASLTNEFDGPINPSDSEFRHPSKHQERVLKKIRLREGLECAEHKYAEAFDVQASFLEEKKLWGLLNLDAPFSIRAENIKLPENPVHCRKANDEMVDWRDRVEFWSQWETTSKHVHAGTFLKPSTRKRKRRVSKLHHENSDLSSEASAEVPGGSPVSENQTIADGGDIDEAGGSAMESDDEGVAGDLSSNLGGSETGQRTALGSPGPEKPDTPSHGSRSSSISGFDPSILPGFTNVMKARMRELAAGDMIYPPATSVETYP